MSDAPKKLDHSGVARRRHAGPVCALICLLVLALLPASAAAAEEGTHIFNATLSLTGGCTESTLDPVPDPGCPGTHAPKAFVKNGGVTVDLYGNRYVASTSLTGSGGRIDVFNSTGQFITEISGVTSKSFMANLAVDTEGYLYVGTEGSLRRYKPTKYNPAAGEIEYGEPPVAIPNAVPGFPAEDQWPVFYIAVAIDPANNHLFVTTENHLLELSSAAEGNGLVEVTLDQGFDKPLIGYANAIALDLTRKRIYLSEVNEPPIVGGTPVKYVIKAFNLEAPHELLFSIDGSTTPTERFVSETRALPVAVDEATGHIFIGDLNAPTPSVYEFDATGNPVSTIGAGILKSTGAIQPQIAYDDSPTSPTQGYLFVPSHSGPGRSLAFEPLSTAGPPAVEALSVSGVTTADAILHGKVNPGGVETSYRVEYTSEQEFQANGFAGATMAGEGTLKAAKEGIPVSAPAVGLSPGTAYRFRIVAESPEGEDEADTGFSTFASVKASTDCPNQALRSGPSALLPDCRAYELVTPANTNGHPPVGPSRAGGEFTDRQISPAGDKLPFRLEGAPLSGLEGTGELNGDPYLATRTAAGWTTTYEGPSAAEAPSISPGTSSPDQGYSFWLATGLKGSALLGGDTSYLRFPDGHSEPLGQGSIGFDRIALGRFISEGGGHIVFQTGILPGVPVRLEPDAAPDGTSVVYDRTADGVTHVVSLPPDEVPFGSNENAGYAGASLDGRDIAFTVNGTLYLRHDDEETLEIGTGVKFAGVAEGGGRVFYLQGGNLKAFDVASEATIDFSQSSDVTPVMVAPDGSAAYFTSPSVLGAANPEGKVAQPGARNLYRSEEGQIGFVGTLTDRDVAGAPPPGDAVPADGLGLWSSSLPEELGKVPAHTTSDGGVLLFKSRAQLTGYDPEGHAEIYRYDSVAGKLDCISCNPTGAAAGSDATLQFLRGEDNNREFFDFNTWLENLSADGRRAFFETSEGLVASDTDGLTDVYEWEQQGVGSCAKPAGCLYLISSGQSGRDEHLWAVSKSGDDVFFISSDLLAGGDSDETPSIYDARVEGGFPPPPTPPGECLGEACQPAAVAPNDATPASSAFQGSGNVKEEKKRAHKKKKHRTHKKKHKQAKAKRRAGR